MPFLARYDWLGERRTFGVSERCLTPFVEVVDTRLSSLSEEGVISLYRAMVRLDMRPASIMEFSVAPEPSLFFVDPERPQRADLPRRGWAWPRPAWLKPNNAAA